MARLLFVQTEWFEHLGVMALAASAKERGHRVSLVLGRDPKRTAARVLAEDPDVAAFSTTTGAHRKALSIARSLRPGFKGKVIMGGPHPTFFPEVIAEPCLDAVCRGEADHALPDFLDKLDARADWENTPGFWAKRGGEITRNEAADLVADLDSLPFPGREVLIEADPGFRRLSMRRVMAGRGCPYNCTYCFNRSLRELVRGKGPYVRTRSVENVLAEIEELTKAGARTINFVDDTFGLKRDWALEFLDRHRAEAGLAFIVNLRPEQVDREMVDALKDAGCLCVQLGVESADPALRAELLGRDVSDHDLEEGVGMLRRAGIRVLTYNMVGLPGESLEGACRTLEWNARVKVDLPRVSIFQPYPRTVLGDKVLGDMGAGNPGGPGGGPLLERAFESYFRASPLQGPEARRIENLHKLFYPYIKLPPARPLIKALTRLPGNPLFEAAFLVSIGVQYKKATNRTLDEALWLGAKNIRAYFS